MNKFELISILGTGVLFLSAYRWVFGLFVQSTIEKTQDQDKSLQQQQLENEQKLAQVNKDLQALYDERDKLKDQYAADQQKTDQEKADTWNNGSKP